MCRDDRPDGSWDPTPIQTTIEFRGKQARYTFPVGVTTLWWYAPDQSFNGTEAAEPEGLYAEHGGKQVPVALFGRAAGQ